MTHWLCVNYCPCDCLPSRALTMGIIFVSQTGVGFLGNILLLLCYGFLSCTGRGIKHMDLILHNLIVANCLVLLSRGIPQTMAAFGLKYLMDDFGCKLVFYVHRVARGVSLSATSLLSGFQAITISLSSPEWMELKVKALKSIQLSILLCWTLHLLVNSIVPMYITAMRESNNLTEKKDLGFCSGLIIDRCISLLHPMTFSFIDVLHNMKTNNPLKRWAKNKVILAKMETFIDGVNKHKWNTYMITINCVWEKMEHKPLRVEFFMVASDRRCEFTGSACCRPIQTSGARPGTPRCGLQSAEQSEARERWALSGGRIADQMAALRAGQI
nr:vomeronasal type-1 receptor 4-like [Oryctolagus cuniculus]